MKAGALVLVVFVLAACGGGTGSGASGGAASILPSTTAAFVALDTHLSASQWPAVAALLKRFPVQDPVLEQLQTLKLGGEVDLAEVGKSLVVLTRSPDAHLPGFVSKRIGGWNAFAHDATSFDALGGNATLASARSYKNAMSTLPSGALARAYAGPAAAKQLLTTLPGQERVLRTRTPGSDLTTEQTLWAVAAVVRRGNDLRLESHARVRSPVPTDSAFIQVPAPPYPARLVDEIPADAVAVVDFQIQTGELELTDQADLPAALQKLVVASPPLLNQLDTVLGGESAIYARPGGELTLVTQPADTNAAIGEVGAIGAFLPGMKLHVTVFGGELVVSTTQQGLAAFRAGGAKLSSDPTFQKVTRAAGLPATTTGFVYSDLSRGAAAFASIAPLFHVFVPKAPERALVFYETRSGRDAGSVLFLQTP